MLYKINLRDKTGIVPFKINISIFILIFYSKKDKLFYASYSKETLVVLLIQEAFRSSAASASVNVFLAIQFTFYFNLLR